MRDFDPAEYEDEGAALEAADGPTEVYAALNYYNQPEEDEAYEPGQKRPLDHGVKLRAKVKRGTETRDQDELLIEGRGQDAEEAAEDFEAALKEAEEREWADRLRALQPGEGDDE